MAKTRDELEAARDARNDYRAMGQATAREVFGSEKLARDIGRRERIRSDDRYPELREARNNEPTPREAQMRGKYNPQKADLPPGETAKSLYSTHDFNNEPGMTKKGEHR